MRRESRQRQRVTSTNGCSFCPPFWLPCARGPGGHRLTWLKPASVWRRASCYCTGCAGGRDFGNPRAFLLMCLTGRAATPWCWRQFGPPDTRKNSQIKTYALRPSQSAKANASGLPAPGAKVAVSKRPMPAAMRTYSIAVAYWSEKPNSFSTIIDAPQRHDRTLNGAFSPSNEGVPCGLRIGITR
jgi:hypothetical protein